MPIATPTAGRLGHQKEQAWTYLLSSGRARDGKNCVILAFVGNEDIKVIKSLGVKLIRHEVRVRACGVPQYGEDWPCAATRHLVNRGASLDSKAAQLDLAYGFSW